MVARVRLLKLNVLMALTLLFCAVPEHLGAQEAG